VEIAGRKRVRGYTAAYIMPDTIELTKYYETLTDDALLNLASEGGFTEEAQQVLAKELRRRNLANGDLKRCVARNERLKLREEAKEKGFRGRGPGLLFFGRRFLNEADKEANIQVRTKFFALGGIPLIPIASYRFQCTGDQGRWLNFYDGNQRIINRVPLNWTQVFLTWIKTAVIIVVIGLLIVVVGEVSIRLR
jgi:hypothetical protein